jgi:pantoate--beta-alanine ligase
MPLVAETVAAVRNAVAQLKRDSTTASPRVVLVPTLGALHDGHIGLVQRAREIGDIVVVSIFVNPLQFGPSEDLDKYPRTLESDLAAVNGLADIVFAPSVSEMYPAGRSETRVTTSDVATLFEGASRPGHFDGVLTVVAKLFNIVGPDVAVFGQKDAQQAFLVKRMVRDLNFPLTVDVIDTVREPSGLALSSRNRFLNPDEKRAAASLSAALSAGAAAAAGGARHVADVARATIAAEPAVKLDYLVVVDPETFLPASGDDRGEQLHGPAILLVAASVGSTRLIDNERLILP